MFDGSVLDRRDKLREPIHTFGRVLGRGEMKMKKRILLALAVVTLVTVGTWGYGQKDKSSNASYEYQVIDDPIQTMSWDDGTNKLNQLGAQGWEIVGIARDRVYLKRTKR